MEVGIVSIQISGSALALLHGLFNTVFEQLILIKASACAKISEEICVSRIDIVPIYALSGSYNLF